MRGSVLVHVLVWPGGGQSSSPWLREHPVYQRHAHGFVGTCRSFLRYFAVNETAFSWVCNNLLPKIRVATLNFLLLHLNIRFLLSLTNPPTKLTEDYQLESSLAQKNLIVRYREWSVSIGNDTQVCTACGTCTSSAS